MTSNSLWNKAIYKYISKYTHKKTVLEQTLDKKNEGDEGARGGNPEIDFRFFSSSKSNSITSFPAATSLERGTVDMERTFRMRLTGVAYGGWLFCRSPNPKGIQFNLNISERTSSGFFPWWSDFFKN